jgi:integrase
MNYNVTIVRKPGSTRLYTSYIFNGDRKVKTTGFPDTKGNRARIEREIIPKYISALVNGQDPTAVALKLSHYLNIVVEKAKDKSLSTHTTYASAAKKWVELLHDKPISTYTTSNIENAIKKMEKSASTINTYLAPLKLAFDEAIKNNEVGVTKNPVTLADRPDERNREKTKPFSLSEVIKMIYVASVEFRKFLLIAFFTGLRHGEILGLRCGDLDPQYNMIIINKQFNIKFNQPDQDLKNHKSKPTREIKVPKIIWEKIGGVSENLNDFVIDQSEMGNSKRAWIHTNWKNVLDLTKIKADGRTPYTTRHTFISLASSSKVNPLLLSDNAGHANLEMITTIYGSIDRNNESYDDFSKMIEEEMEE